MLSFGPLVSLSAGQFPGAVAAADFNGDGRADLATTTFNSIGVLLGNGDGTFQTVRHSGTAGNSLVACDLDGDARTDLVAITESDLRVLLGNGDGTFQSPLVIVLESQLPAGTVGLSPVQTPTSVAVADLNGDGYVDLIAGGYDVEEVLYEELYREDDYVNVFLGTGNGTFGSGTTYHVTSVYNTLHATGVLGVGDFDGDGEFDVLVNDHGRLSVFAGSGDGTLHAAPRVSDVGFVAGGPALRVADFDHDGRLDVLSGSSVVSVMRGNGDGTFSPGQAVSFGAAIQAAALGDVNADGQLDILGTVSEVVIPYPDEPVTTRTTRVLLGDGNGSFGSPIVSDFGAVPAQSRLVSAVLADFDGDELPELALSDFRAQGSGFTYGTLGVAHNEGDWAPPAQPPPSISIGGATVTEGNSGPRAASFAVTLSAASAQAVTVTYTAAGGTATADSDYQATSATLTIPAGQMTGTISVLVNGDRVPEANETFFVNLTGSTNATIADGQAVGTIVDDEPRVSISDVTRSEGRKGKTTLFTFTVTLSAAYDQAVTMSYHTVNGTATSGSGDYVARIGTLTFAPGETTKTITISVKGDSKREANETFYLDLFGLSSNALFTKNRGIGTILNDD